MNPAADDPLRWWERLAIVLAILLLSAVPLLWPDVPALIDLPGHIGRYRIMLDLDTSAALRRFFDFRWALVPNLGVDLLMVPLAKLVGLKPAVRLIVIAIPPLTVAGFLWVAREAHGRIPPALLFAAPFAYGSPFLGGFLNFSLSMALAFLAAGLWLYLWRLRRLRLRAALFPIVSATVWLCHAVGWGTLGLLAFSFEFAREAEEGRTSPRAVVSAATRCLPLAMPIVLIAGWQSGNVNAGTSDWLDVPWKLFASIVVLRDRWQAFDIVSVALCGAVIFAGVREPKLLYSRGLATAAVLLTLAFLAMPRILLGAAHADDRLVPYVFATALLGIGARPGGDRLAARLAVAGLAFFLARTAASTASFALYDRSWNAELAALSHVPAGARVAAFVGMPCERTWFAARLEHLPGLAIARRDAFANDQWTVAGSQLLQIKPPWTRYADPSQMVTRVGCASAPWPSLDEALAALPRGDFDYVWLIDPPVHKAASVRGLTPVWRAGTSVLFRLPERGS